ncbi:hypothetical protein MRX96_015862 [Rhipicephalus microplus]
MYFLNFCKKRLQWEEWLRTDISLLFHPAWIILVASRSTSASSCSVKFFNQRVSLRSGRQGLEVAASLRTKKYLGNF